MGKDFTLYVRIEEVEKQEFEKLVPGLGMNPSQAVRLFIKKALALKAIPFRVGMAVEGQGGAQEEKEDYESFFT